MNRNKKALLILFLTAWGVLVNHFHVTLFFGVDFLFGGVATFLILGLLGPVPAIATVPLITLKSYFLWHHPYFIVISLCEIAVVSYFYIKKNRDFLTSGTLYWLFMGLPLVALFYGLLMGHDWRSILNIGMKQALNGVANALLASLLLVALNFIQHDKIKGHLISFQQMLLHIFVACILLPAFVLLVFNGQAEMRRTEREKLAQVEDTAKTLSDYFGARMLRRTRAVEQFSRRFTSPDMLQIESLNAHARFLLSVFDEFAWIAILNHEGTPLLFEPQGSTFAFSYPGTPQSLLRYLNPPPGENNLIFTDVIASNSNLGPIIGILKTLDPLDFDTRYTIVAAMSVERLSTELESLISLRGTEASLLRADGAPLASTTESHAQVFPPEVFPTLLDGASPHLYHWLPSSPNLSAVQRWESSAFGAVLPLKPEIGWFLMVESRIGEEVRILRDRTSLHFLFLTLLGLVSLLVAWCLSRIFSQPVRSLTRATTDIPERVTSGQSIQWPQSHIEEFHTLILNFRQVGEALAQRFNELRKTTEKLKTNEVELREHAHQLEEAAKQKDEFLATISHELRTPLNVIVGNVDLLRLGILDAAETITALETLKRNAHAQKQLINDLLDVSRIITGKVELNPKPLNLSNVVTEATETFKLPVQAKNLNFNVQVPDEEVQILGDIDRLRQILWNLLSNAVKFTPHYGHITLSLEKREGVAFLEVKDSGIGIQPEFVPYVFDRFRQEDSSSTRVFGGLGLGLAIVRHLTELHGGTVKAESEGKDKGSNFKICLPLHEEGSISPLSEKRNCMPPTGENIPESPLSSHTSPPHAFNGHPRILIVDDSEDARKTLALALRKVGALVVEAPDASEAYRLFRVQRFDVVLLDVKMPDEDGISLIKRIRNYEKECNTAPTVAGAYTEYSSYYDEKRCLEAGFNLFLSKTMSSCQIIERICFYLRSNPEKPAMTL